MIGVVEIDNSEMIDFDLTIRIIPRRRIMKHEFVDDGHKLYPFITASTTNTLPTFNYKHHHHHAYKHCQNQAHLL